MDCSAIEQTPGWGGSQQKDRMGVTVRGCLGNLQALKQACMSAPVLTFAYYTKDFLLQTDASKEGQGLVLSQNKQTGNTTQSPMAARPSLPMKRTIILQNLNS